VRLENRLADLLGVKVDLSPARTLKDGIRERAAREAVLAF
jgi:predicted nucleotidyltransferase